MHFDLNWKYLQKNNLTGHISDYTQLLDIFTKINIQASQTLEQYKLTSGAAYYFNNKKDDRNLAIGKDDIINHHFGIGGIPGSFSSISQAKISHRLNQLEKNQIDTLISFMGEVSINHNILDAGCGRGGTSIVINQRFGSNVIGINISEYQVDFANNIASKKELSKVKFVLMDYLNPEFPDNYFDHVVINEATQYTNSLQKLFAGFQRILKENGRLTIATWCMKNDYSDENWAIKINEHYGLKMHSIDEYTTALGYYYKDVRCNDYSDKALPYFLLRDKWLMKSGVEPYYIEGLTTKKLIYAFITATNRK